MKLSDLRKLAIRQQSTFRFGLAGGRECVVDERGVARVPGLNEPPDFNLEDELAGAAHVTVQAAGGVAPGRRMSRAEMEKLIAGQGRAEVCFEEHDE